MADSVGDAGARTLLSKLEELKRLRQKLVSEHQTMDSLQRHRREREDDADAEGWRTRAMVAETRVGDLEILVEEERKMRHKLTEQNRKLESAFKQEREAFEREISECMLRERDLHLLIKREKAKGRKAIEALQAQLVALGEQLDRSEVDMEQTVSSVREVESELMRTIKDRDDAVAEVKVLKAKLEMLEKSVLPKAAEDQRKLEAEVTRLREDLHDSMESETALRALFLQDQNARLRRRSRGENPL